MEIMVTKDIKLVVSDESLVDWNYIGKRYIYFVFRNRKDRLNTVHVWDKYNLSLFEDITPQTFIKLISTHSE